MKIALLFPGQGSQYAGMGRQLYNGSDIAREIIEDASEILNFNMNILMDSQDITFITEHEHLQATIFTLGYAAFRTYMKQINVLPSYLLGHSLGEYTALAAAGVFQFSDALKLVSFRSKVMRETASYESSSMLSIIGYTPDEIKKRCNQILDRYPSAIIQISNYNSAHQSVVAGDVLAVKELSNELGRLGVRCKWLNVRGACHTPLMFDAAKRLEAYLDNVEIREFNIPVIANVTSRPYERSEVKHLLVRHMVEPVKWTESIKNVYLMGTKLVIDIGPNEILKNLMADINTSMNIEGYKISDVSNISRYLLSINERCVVAAVASKNYSDHTHGYTEAVMVLMSKLKVVAFSDESNLIRNKRSISLLNEILLMKKTPENRRLDVIKQVLRDTDYNEKLYWEREGKDETEFFWK